MGNRKGQKDLPPQIKRRHASRVVLLIKIPGKKIFSGISLSGGLNQIWVSETTAVSEALLSGLRNRVCQEAQTYSSYSFQLRAD